MKCPNCGADNPGTARFCGQCGEAMVSPSIDDRKKGSSAILRIAVGAMAFALVALVAYVGFSAGGTDAIPTAEATAELNATNAPDESEVTSGSSGKVVQRPTETVESITLQNAVTIGPQNAAGLLQLASWQTNEINDLSISPEDARLAVATDQGVRIYALDTFEEERLIGSPAPIYSVAFSRDGLLVAGGSEDNVLRLWSVRDGTLLQTIQGPAGPVTSVDFSPDGKALASGSSDGIPRLWQMGDWASSKVLRYPIDEPARLIHQIAFSVDGQFVAVVPGLDKSVLDLWQAGKDAVFQFSGSDSSVRCVAFSHGGETMASGYEDGMVRLWPVSEETHMVKEAAIAALLRVKYIPEEAETYHWTSYLSADNQFLLLLEAEDGKKMLARPGERIEALLPEQVGVTSVAEDGLPLAIEGYQRLSRIETVRYLGELGAMEFGIGDSAVTIASFEVAGPMKQRYSYDPDEDAILDLQSREVYRSTGTRFTSLSGESLQWAYALQESALDSGAVNGLAFAPSGDLLAVATARGLTMLDGQDLQQLLMIPQEDAVKVVEFSGDGRFLVTASEDNVLRLWIVPE